MTHHALRLYPRTDTEVPLKSPFVDLTPGTRRRALYSAVCRLLRRYNVPTRRTLGPHTVGAVVLFVLHKNPRFRYVLTTFRATTEGRFVSVHGRGEGACDSVPSNWISSGGEPKPLAALWVERTEFPEDTDHQ